MENVSENKHLKAQWVSLAVLVAVWLAFLAPNLLRLKGQLPLQIVFWSSPVIMLIGHVGIQKLRPWLMGRSVPLPFLKPWIRFLIAALVYGVVNVAIQEVVKWHGFPIPMEDYKVYSKLKIGVAALWGWWAFGVFYEVSGYFAAMPKLPEPPASQPPPVPRDEWWKKYY